MTADLLIGLVYWGIGTLVSIIVFVTSDRWGKWKNFLITQGVSIGIGLLSLLSVRLSGNAVWVFIPMFLIFVGFSIWAGIDSKSKGVFFFSLAVSFLIPGILFGISYWITTSIPVDTISFVGKIVNPSTGKWNNNRLVIIYKDDKEIGRTQSMQGEYKDNGLGIIDGLFFLEITNEYKLTNRELKTFQFKQISDNFWDSHMTLRTWIPEVLEGTGIAFHVDSKNIDYTLMVLDGEISTLPPEIVNGTTELRNGQIVVASPATVETTPEQEYSDVIVGDIEYNLKTEEIPVNTILPINVLNNCNGTVEVSQKYTQTQTFIHKYTSEIGLTIGAEIPIGVWGKIMPSLQAQYGFEDGQVDTISIEYNTAAAPGTSVAYIVTLKELWESGVATVATGNSEGKVPFRVKTNLIYEITSQPRSCP